MRKCYRSRQRMVVKRRVTEKNAFNFEIVSWKKVSTVKGGYIDAINGEMIKQGERRVETSTHLLVCDYANIQINDRIVVNGKSYQVNFVYNPMEANRHLEVELELVTESNKEPVKNIYFGTNTNETLTASDVAELDSMEAEDKSLRQSFVVEGEYISFAYPVEFGKASVRLNGMLDMSF